MCDEMVAGVWRDSDVRQRHVTGGASRLRELPLRTSICTSRFHFTFSEVWIVLEARQDRRFIAHRHVQCVGEQDRVRFARIHTALENDVADQFIVSDTQTLETVSYTHLTLPTIYS